MVGTSINVKGYDITEVSLNKWILFVKGTEVAVSGTFKQIVKYAVEKLGFKTEELNIAVEEYIKNQDKGHDTMHFGAYKTLLFTLKREVSQPKKDYTN